MEIVITGPRDRGTAPPSAVVVNTTSTSSESWSRSLSPFHLGPVNLYGGRAAKKMENAWQFAKVHQDHLDKDGNPNDAYWEWASKGWGMMQATRYPRGKGAKPAYTYWDGEKLGYLEARNTVYFPLYREAVRKTEAFNQLVRLARTKTIVLWDFDGYDHEQQGKGLADVMSDISRPLGHAFILKAMLLYGPAVTLEELAKKERRRPAIERI